MLLLAGLTACDAQSQVPAQDTAEQRPAAPLALTGRVVDAAGVIEESRERAMGDFLAALERDLGVQFVVVSTPDLGGMPIDRYALALGNGWALGDRERNDGLILLVAPNQRQARIEVGLGLEPVLTDEFCAEVIRLMLPSFREGNYADGISVGMVSLDARLRKVARENEA